MTTTETLIADLNEKTIIADNDLFIAHDVTSNETKKAKYSTVKNQIAADLHLINQTTLDSTVATINAAITAAINNLKQNDIYAVGKLFISSTDDRNPNTILGFGSWIRVSKFLAGYNTTDSDFSPVGKTGGSKTHAHGGATGGHALAGSENGPHTHIYRDRYYIENASVLGAASAKEAVSPAGYNGNVGSLSTDSDNDTFLYTDRITEPSGLGTPHTHPLSTDSNLPPYEVVYIWKRLS